MARPLRRASASRPRTTGASGASPRKSGCSASAIWARTPRTKYYLVDLPATASLQALVRLAHQRWAIEQQYQELKDELGLDHFEGRSLAGLAAPRRADRARLRLAARRTAPPRRAAADPARRARGDHRNSHGAFLRDAPALLATPCRNSRKSTCGSNKVVLDIRTNEDRAQWTIPGSVHVNAYEALRDGQPGALAHATFPVDRPVVTVCNAGRVSQTAAEMLADRGFDARSLAGGMKAWSLAWNTAEVSLAEPSVRVIQVRRTGKGCLSYIVSSAGEAAVIDPSVSPDVYLEFARRHGWSIRFVLETHVHADHLSRAPELARRTGATLLLPAQERVTFPFTPITHGERVLLGDASLTAVHTPGHTNESTSYVLNESAVFTGDTLFTNGVGRPTFMPTLRPRANEPAHCSRRSHGCASRAKS